MVTIVKDPVRSIKDSVDKFSEDFVNQTHGRKSRGVADIPDTTSKVAIEKDAIKNTTVSWFESWTSWIWNDPAATDTPAIEKVTEPLSVKPQIPRPHSTAAKSLANILRETNIITGRVQEANESDAHKAFITLYQEQVKLRESAAQSQIGRLQSFRKQLQVNRLTQQMLMEEINQSNKIRPYLNIAHKTCNAVVLTAFGLTGIAFAASATGGTAIPVFAWIAAHAGTLATSAGIAQATGAIGSGITQGTSAYLQQRSETAEAKVLASRHQSDLIDLEMKAFQQWLKEVFTAVTTLQRDMRRVEQKRFEASKTQE